MKTTTTRWTRHFGRAIAISLLVAGSAVPALANVTITSPNQATFTAGTNTNTFTVTTSFSGGAPTIIKKGKRWPGTVKLVDNLNGTATLSGDPGSGSVSTAVKLVAQNSTGKDTQNFTLLVQSPPNITSANSMTCAVNVACSFTVTTTGNPIPAITKSGTLPAGMTFTDNHNRTATITGTPAGGSDGTYPLTLTAANGVPPNATQSFTIKVNRSLAITSAAAKTCLVGTACSFTFTAVGVPTPSLAITGGTLPPNLLFTDNHNGTATLSGTAAVGSGGGHPLVVTASNGAETDAVQNFALTVNEAPSFSSANNQTCAIGFNCQFDVVTLGYPIPTITAGGDAFPADVAFFDNGDRTGTFSGVVAGGTAGTYNITFTAANGIGANQVQNFTLKINAALGITSANATTCVAGTPCTFAVTANGAPPVVLSRTGTLPTGITFTDNGDSTATLAGTAAAGTGGTWPLTLNAHNAAEGDAPQTFTLTVNQAPAITSANTLTCKETVSCNFLVTSTGFPVAAYALSGDAFPSAINFGDSSDGTAIISGTPDKGTAGTYNVVINAANGTLPDAAQNFTFVVQSADPPSKPLGVTALAGNAQASVFFSPPSSNGGFTITGYVATCTPTSGPTGVIGTGTASPITVSGLANGTTYTCTVHATNTNGDSPESDVSNPVTPSAAAAATLTVTTSGSGLGSVTSFPADISCPGTCAHSYPAGTGVQLTALAQPGSTFVGWLGGGCGTTSPCTVVIGADVTVAAYFAPSSGLNPGNVATLDIDNSDAPTKYDALTDGVLVLRAMFGLTGTSLTNGVVAGTAQRNTASTIISYIGDIGPALDIDGNGKVDALTDGLMIVRYLFGLRGASLIQGAIGLGATRTTTTAIENYLATLTP